MIKKITATEYINIVGISKPALMYRIKNGRVLPGVKDYQYDMDSKKYVFEFDTTMTREKAQEYFQKLDNFQAGLHVTSEAQKV